MIPLIYACSTHDTRDTIYIRVAYAVLNIFIQDLSEFYSGLRDLRIIYADISVYSEYTQNLRKIYAKYAPFKQRIQPMCVFSS